ncbi:MAG: hypothetical protein Q9195_005796 [Heterodermia aff. obscurata]
MQDKIADLAYTLACRREHLPHRAFAVVGGSENPSVSSYMKIFHKVEGVTMLFSGQGAQSPRMAFELMRKTQFQADIDEMDRILQSFTHRPDWTMKAELLKAQENSNLDRSDLAQPICTALQIALVDAMARLDIRPSAVVGHSSGEIAAAYACGAISKRAAMAIAYYRGYVSRDKSSMGRMAAVGLGVEEVAEYLVTGVVVACDNSPNSATLSGEGTKLDSVLSRIREQKPDTLVRKLKVDMAYHSEHMNLLADEYRLLLEQEFQSAQLQLSDPNVPFFSSVSTKQVFLGSELGISYWISNLLSRVRFKAAIQRVAKSQPKNLLLEIGPHSTLAGPSRDSLGQIGLDHSYVSTMKRYADSEHELLSAIGEIWQHGLKIKWEHLAPQGEVLTDLPTYSWDHSGSHWYEGHISQQWRFRKFGHHSLLGLHVLETTCLAPCWRNSLSLEEEIWLYDHKIHNDVILPFAGYCSMASEALRQLTSSKSGCILNSVVVRSALMLDESKPVEIRTILLPQKPRTSQSASVYDFKISSLSGSQWVINCGGQIRPLDEEFGLHGQRDSRVNLKSKLVNGDRHSKDADDNYRPFDGLLREMPSSEWISALSRVGINIGQTFQCLSAIRVSAGKYVATAMIRGEGSGDSMSSAAHTCTIDACLQLAFIASAKGLERNMTRLVLPTTVETMAIGFVGKDMTARAWSSDNGKTFSVECLTDGIIVMSIAGLEVKQLDDEKLTIEQDHGAAELKWRPHFDFTDHSSLLAGPSSSPELVRLREEIALLCMIDCAERLLNADANAPHLKKWRNWMTQKIDQARMGIYPVLENPTDFLDMDLPKRKTLIQEKLSSVSILAPEDSFTTAIARIWQSVEAIYTGRDSALSILTQDNLLTNIYNENSFDHSNLIQSLSHTNPTMSILEVGAGTGGTTQTFLKDLVDVNGCGHPRYKLYTFTDISDGFFSQAKQRFAFAPNMQYKVFDISQDPQGQDFETGTYDLILAANVVHATPRLGGTLQNLRTLLKDDGILVLTELITVTSALSFVFGTLPGWWLGEADGRPNEPFTDVGRWDRELRASGFAGADTVVQDAEKPYQYSAAIIARATAPASNSCKHHRDIYFLSDGMDEGIANALIQAFIQADRPASVLRLGEKLPRQDCDIIATLDLKKPFLEDISEVSLGSLQKTLRQLTTQKVLWLTTPTQMSCPDPRAAQSIGLVRAIRAELDLPVFTLEIDETEKDFIKLVLQVFDLVQKSEDKGSLLPDREFVVRHGQVHVGRYQQIDLAQRYLSNDNLSHVNVLPADGHVALEQSTAWVSEGRPDDIAPGYLQLIPSIHGVNAVSPTSAFSGQDSSAKTAIQCCELVGEVFQVGPMAENAPAIGSNVVALRPPGAIKTHVTVDSRLTRNVPESIDLENVPLLPISFVTAYRALVEVGLLEKNQSVLIHLAASDIGDAAIQICTSMDVDILATVDNYEEAVHIGQSYGLSLDNIYLIDDEKLVERVLKTTRGQGVNLVLNSSTQDLLETSWRCVARYGKFLDLGLGDLTALDRFDMRTFLANRCYCCIDIDKWIQERPEDVGRPLFKTTSIEAETQSLGTHVTFLNKSEQTKTAVKMLPDSVAPNTQQKAKELRLDPQAVYILTGGLGGLGSSLAIWMAEHGAKRLIILSRSGGTSKPGKRLVAELAGLGCSMLPIAGRAECKEDVLNAVSMAGDKPIRGIVHLAMLLRDASILEMSHSDWTAAVSPKVNGAWNLHNVLTEQGHSLDFFLLTSSLFTTIEHPGQGNYNAANTFLEAFCQYRHSLGLAASVLNICPIDRIGFFADNPSARQKMTEQGFYFLDENAFLDFATSSILNSQPGPSQTGTAWKNRCHLFMGLHSALALSDPANRVSWRRDRRMGFYHNGASSSDKKTSVALAYSSNPHDEGLAKLLVSSRSDPSLLAQPSAHNIIAIAIGRQIFRQRLRDEEQEVDVGMGLMQMGVDSLVAVELRRWIRIKLGADISVVEMLAGRTLEEVGALVAGKISADAGNNGGGDQK